MNAIHAGLRGMAQREVGRTAAATERLGTALAHESADFGDALEREARTTCRIVAPGALPEAEHRAHVGRALSRSVSRSAQSLILPWVFLVAEASATEATRLLPFARTVDLLCSSPKVRPLTQRLLAHEAEARGIAANAPAAAAGVHATVMGFAGLFQVPLVLLRCRDLADVSELRAIIVRTVPRGDAAREVVALAASLLMAPLHDTVDRHLWALEKAT